MYDDYEMKDSGNKAPATLAVPLRPPESRGLSLGWKPCGLSPLMHIDQTALHAIAANAVLCGTGELHGLRQEAQEHPCGHGATDDTGHVGPHGMHEQMVSLIVL